MPTVQRSYKLRCYPTREQAQRLARDFGCARWVWKTCLAWRSDLYQAEGVSVTGVDFSRELTFVKRLPGYEWLADAPATILTQKLRDQDRAFRNFFEGRAQYPRFKKSKTCSHCGHVLDTLPLSLRAWSCPACGAAHDRDVNAARNLLAWATGGGREPEMMRVEP